MDKKAYVVTHKKAEGMRKINSFFSLIKMRRNVKLIIIFCISWMFLLLYYLQGTTNNKVRELNHISDCLDDKKKHEKCRIIKPLKSFVSSRCFHYEQLRLN